MITSGQFTYLAPTVTRVAQAQGDAHPPEPDRKWPLDLRRILPPPCLLSLRSLEKCILAPKSLGTASPGLRLESIRLFEMEELVSILVEYSRLRPSRSGYFRNEPYLLGMPFLPASSHLTQTNSAIATAIPALVQWLS